MVFKCQEDSFLKKFSAKVISCTKSVIKSTENGSKETVEGFEVILDNTILFPEGGGQPYDLGWLDDKEVLQVIRSGEDAVHFLREPVEEGAIVTQTLDWKRRFDHMQQHTGQHLLSAILENEYFIKTTAWWLGEEECHVELDCTTLIQDTIIEVEKRCNDLIREAVPVTVKECDVDDPSLNKLSFVPAIYVAHTRGLPKDHSGKVRIIKIEEIDENLCCGTHVTNLSHLQVIKLLRTEPGKKGKTNLRFIVGQRVISGFQQKMDREQAMTALLKNDPSRHEVLVKKLQMALKSTNKNVQTLLAEAAKVQIEKIKNSEPKLKYFCLHKAEADVDFMRAICKGLEDMDVFLLLATGDSKSGEGNILMQATETDIAALTPRICEILQGKGAAKNMKYQAKVTKLNKFPTCVKFVEEYFKNK